MQRALNRCQVSLWSGDRQYSVYFNVFFLILYLILSVCICFCLGSYSALYSKLLILKLRYLGRQCQHSDYKPPHAPACESEIIRVEPYHLCLVFQMIGVHHKVRESLLYKIPHIISLNKGPFSNFFIFVFFPFYVKSCKYLSMLKCVLLVQRKRSLPSYIKL